MAHTRAAPIDQHRIGITAHRIRNNEVIRRFPAARLLQIENNDARHIGQQLHEFIKLRGLDKTIVADMDHDKLAQRPGFATLADNLQSCRHRSADFSIHHQARQYPLHLAGRAQHHRIAHGKTANRWLRGKQSLRRRARNRRRAGVSRCPRDRWCAGVSWRARDGRRASHGRRARGRARVGGCPRICRRPCDGGCPRHGRRTSFSRGARERRGTRVRQGRRLRDRERQQPHADCQAQPQDYQPTDYPFHAATLSLMRLAAVARRDFTRLSHIAKGQLKKAGFFVIILPRYIVALTRRGARVVEWGGLENRCGSLGHPGFESLPLRHLSETGFLQFGWN
jgi:hypothetical protein